MKAYSSFQFILGLFQFRLRAKSWKSVHSPFLLAFIQDGLRPRLALNFSDIERVRRSALRSDEVLSFTDYGNQSMVVERTVSQIARRSLKPRKYAEIIAKCCHYSKAVNALELGTSLGITTAYMARSVKGEVYSFEGGVSILNKAQSHWKSLGIENINSYAGDFTNSLSMLPNNLKLDVVFIDGHHQKEPTLVYFNRLLPHCKENSILIFDDIHWSSDMEKAWREIQQHPQVTACIDIYFIGLVFLNRKLSKELIELNF